MPRPQTINSDLYVQTFKNLQKRFRRVLPHTSVTEVLLQHDNARPRPHTHTHARAHTHTHTHTHTSAGAFETQEEIKSLPTQLTAHIVLPQIYTSLEPSKMPSAEKVL